MSRYDRYSPDAMGILGQAQALVRQDHAAEFGVRHLLVALLKAPSAGVREFLRANTLQVRTDTLEQALREGQPQAAPAAGGESAAAPGEAPRIRLSPQVRAILDDAERSAGSRPVSSHDLLRAAWPALGKDLVQLVERHGETPAVESLSLPAAPLDAPAAGVAPASAAAVPLTELGRLGRELTAEDRRLPFVGREKEIDSLVSILLKCFKPNPLIIGEPGVGKTALVEGLAQRIREGRVPDLLKHCRVFEVRVSDLFAGTGIAGSFEERMKNAVAELEAHPEVILFLDEVHQLARQDRPSSNPADILKPALGRGRFRCIGATTAADYYRVLRGDAALTRRFHLLRLDPPDREQTLVILKGLRQAMESHYGLRVSDTALGVAVSCAESFFPQRRFPDKAIDLLDQSCSEAVRQKETELSAQHVRNTVAQLAGVPFLAREDALAEQLDHLEERLAERVFGQDGAVRAVANTVRLCKRGLDLRPERPDGVFLFTGPSGVGKTALAEALAECLTGTRDLLMRIDMSEFSEAHTISRLIGSPAGYVGYGDEPQLIRDLKRCPTGVLLLDEFEKAHPAIHRLFLQAFDSGRLTDAVGETYSLATITIVATANVRAASGTRHHLGFQAGAESAPTHDDGPLVHALSAHFSLELVNRFDEIVEFQPLTEGIALAILRQRILGVASRNLRERRHVELVLSPDAENLILRQGFSEDFGVRHLQRAFEDLVLNPIARDIEAFVRPVPGKPAPQRIEAGLSAAGTIVFRAF